jgi:Kdo2-lipid IVA lauroyltransferase/acyltransferase
MKKNEIIQGISFYMGYPFLWAMGLLPLSLLYRISDIFFLIVAAVGYRKKVINNNLKRAFPEKSNSEIKKIRLQFYRHFSDLFVETLVLQHISVQKIKKRVTIVNPEIMYECINQGRDSIAVLGHYGNWEWIPVASLTFDVVGASVYRPLKNKWFDRFMLNLRSRYKSINIPLNATAREIVKYKRANKRFVLGLISDQSPGKYELHYWTTFLNENTPVILGPEKMARLADAKVFYWQMKKIKRGRYQITFIPFPGEAKTAPEYEITEWQVRLLEEQIREKPEYWLWSHKRWKYQHLYNPEIHKSKQS